MKTFARWLAHKWRKQDEVTVQEAFRVVFSGLHGQILQQWMMDNIYSTICESTDPIAIATHNGRRSAIHELFENIDQAEHPDKYQVGVETEQDK